MTHSTIVDPNRALIEQCLLLRRHALWVNGLFAFGRIVVWGLAGMLLCALLEWYARRTGVLEPSYLFLCWVAVWLLAIGWYGWPHLRRLPSLVDMALRIESLDPSLGGLLSSAVSFAQQPSVATSDSSALLKHEVTRQAVTWLTHIQRGQLIDTSRARASLLWAAAMTGVWTSLLACAPHEFSLAMTHIVMPWRSLGSGPTTNLEFIAAPRAVAAGADYTVRVHTRNGRLPDALHLQIVPHDRSAAQRAVEMQRDGESMVHVLRQITAPFSLRAVASNPAMAATPWLSVEVKPAPRIVSLRWQVRPPAYVGTGPYDPTPHMRVLAGSEVQLTGVSDCPLHNVWLATAPEVISPGDRADADRVTAAIDQADPRQFSATILLANEPLALSQTWSLVLVDKQGISATIDLGPCHVVMDRPATILWQKAQAISWFTPRARLPLRATVRDEMPFSSVSLQWQSTNGSFAPREFEIRRAPSDGGDSGRRRTPQFLERTWTIEHLWDFTKHPVGPIGSHFQFRLSVTDRRGQLSVSDWRTGEWVSPEEACRRLLAWQSSLAQQLELVQQQQARLAHECAVWSRIPLHGHHDYGQMNELRESTGSFRLRQKGIIEQLDTGPQSVRATFATIAAAYDANQLAAEHVARPWHQAERLFQELMTSIYPTLEGHLEEVWRWSQQVADTDDRVLPAQVSTAGAALVEVQRKATDQLQAIHDRLIQGTTRQQLLDQLTRLADEQGGILADIQQTHRVELTRDPTAIDHQGLQVWTQLSKRQAELAHRYEEWIQQADRQAHMGAPGTDPQLVAACTFASDSKISVSLRQATTLLDLQQPGKARAAVEAVLKGLQQIANLLQPSESGTAGNDHAHEGILPPTLIDSLLAQQRTLHTETHDMHLRQQSEPASRNRRSNRFALRALATRQHELAEQLAAIIALPGAKAVHPLLERARDAMGQAAERLQREEVSTDVLDAQETALAALAQIESAQRVEDLASDTPAANSPAAGAATAPPTESDDSMPDSSAAGSGPQGGSNSAHMNTTSPAAEVQQVRRQVLDRVWGDLPAPLRGTVQSVGNETMLPGYEGWIESYFRELSQMVAPAPDSTREPDSSGTAQ